MTGVSVDDVLTYAADFERSYVAVVHGRIKLRVGKIVYVAFSRDETTMGFGFPKEDRPALVASDPERFLMPGQSDMRFNWVVTRLDLLDHERNARVRARRVGHGGAEVPVQGASSADGLHRPSRTCRKTDAFTLNSRCSVSRVTF